MNKQRKKKKQQLIGVIALTLLTVAGLWFGLIRSQQQALTILSEHKQTASKKLDQVIVAIKNGPRFETEATAASEVLEKLESGMANGDLYSWVINTMRDFKQPYQVDIPQFGQIDGPRPNSMLPQFPYKQATLTIAGTAFYQDFGKFVADLENQFPYVRLVNVNLEPAAAPSPADAEKLSFRLEVVALVKPGSA